MFTYNTTRPPITLKAYGRHLQNLLAEIAKLSDKEQKTAYAKSIIPLMTNIVTKKNYKESEDVTKLWHNLFVMSDYKLNIEAPVSVTQEKKDLPPPNPVPYQTKKNEFKGFGRHLTFFTKTLMSQLDQLPYPKESLIALIKLIQLSYKANVPTIIGHIEKIAKEKIPFSYEEIKPALSQRKYK